jgi:hypothetical protein
MKPLSRRSLTTGLAAAVTAIPAVGPCVSAKPAPEKRLRLAFEELRAALAHYYPGVTFNITPYCQDSRIAFYSPGDGEPIVLSPLTGNPEVGSISICLLSEGSKRNIALRRIVSSSLSTPSENLAPSLAGLFVASRARTNRNG